MIQQIKEEYLKKKQELEGLLFLIRRGRGEEAFYCTNNCGELSVIGRVPLSVGGMVGILASSYF